MTRTVKFQIYRYDPDKDAKPYMQDLTVTLQDAMGAENLEDVSSTPFTLANGPSP